VSQCTNHHHHQPQQRSDVIAGVRSGGPRCPTDFQGLQGRSDTTQQMTNTKQTKLTQWTRTGHCWL